MILSGTPQKRDLSLERSDPSRLLAAAYKIKRWYKACLRPFPLETRAMLDGLDLKKFDEIARRNAIPQPGNQPYKYLEIEKWMGVSLQRILYMGLDLCPRRRILDLGCGTGYFLHINKRLGHQVMGLDWPGCPPWYQDVLEVLGIPRRVWTITACQPLPDLGGRFDLVTAFMICFNGHKSEALWKEAEWAYFLDDLQKHLNPNAVVWLELNPESPGEYAAPELVRFFESRGALVDGKRVIWGVSRGDYLALTGQK